ncbi:MAG: hypothetical protein WBD63_03240 [Phycisphaerae bacterium]
MIKNAVASCLCSLMLLASAGAQDAAKSAGVFETPLTLENLDAAAFAAWVDGAEKPMDKIGPQHVVVTKNTASALGGGAAGVYGASFGDSEKSGIRHMRIGWKTPLTVGTVLVRGNVRVSALKADAAYPGNMANEGEWIPAVRLKGGAVSKDEAAPEVCVVWVLPPNTATRALRFTHTAAAGDGSRAVWIGGIYIISERFANIAPQAIVPASGRNEETARMAAARIINGIYNDSPEWDNAPDAGAKVVSPENPATVTLIWPQAVKIRGLNALSAGFASAEVDVYKGAPDRDPFEAKEADWQLVKKFDGIELVPSAALVSNWLDFGQDIGTRAVRLRITKATREIGHLVGHTKDGTRVWLGELMALQMLADQDIQTALLPAEAVRRAAVRFRAAAIRKATGAPTKVVWIQDAGEAACVNSERPTIRLMGLDTEDIQGERPILPGIGWYAKPLLTADGKRVVFADLADHSVNVVNFDGTGRRLIVKDVEKWKNTDVWTDPGSGVTWVYASIMGKRGDEQVPTIRRYQIDHPEVNELVWDKSPVNMFMLSGDGRFASGGVAEGGNVPLGIFSLPNQGFKTAGNGCWPSMCPDGRRLWIFDGSHRKVLISSPDELGGGPSFVCTLVNVPGIFAESHAEVGELYHPRWSNHPRFLALTGSYKEWKWTSDPKNPQTITPEAAAKVKVYLGRFAPDFGSVEEWVTVTDNQRGDYWPDAWVQPKPGE